MTISLEQAQLQLADLVERTRQGEEVVITKDGQAVARLLPAPAPASQIRQTPRFRDVVPLQTGGISASELLIQDRR